MFLLRFAFTFYLRSPFSVVLHLCFFMVYLCLFFFMFFMVLCTLLFMFFFFYDFPLPGPILALENNGFAKEILGKSLKIHEFPRKA